MRIQMRIADCGLRISSDGFRKARERAFTMIEIAFSLAIVAFAMVALMGVLPTGMTVQKDNREDTVINHDAAFWLESLRSGSRGLNDLTNYVESIMITNNKGQFLVYVTNSFGPGSRIVSAEQIIGLLLTPKYTNTGTEFLTNTVIARVRAINGPAVEKGNPTNEVAFRYELRPELVSLSRTPPGGTSEEGAIYDAAIQTNWHQLRVTLRWPMFEQGTNWGVGRNKRTARTAITGHQIPRFPLAPFNNLPETGTNSLNFVEPNVYAYVLENP